MRSRNTIALSAVASPLKSSDQFDIHGNMKTTTAVSALGALAQEHRLEIFRLLVRTGADGLSVGDIAEKLTIAAPTLSFHLAQLKHAGLIHVRRDGRSLIYAANYDGMNGLMEFLTENCCQEDGKVCTALLCDPAEARVVRKKPKKTARQ